MFRGCGRVDEGRIESCPARNAHARRREIQAQIPRLVQKPEVSPPEDFPGRRKEKRREESLESLSFSKTGALTQCELCGFLIPDFLYLQQGCFLSLYHSQV